MNEKSTLATEIIFDLLFLMICGDLKEIIALDYLYPVNSFHKIEQIFLS